MSVYTLYFGDCLASTDLSGIDFMYSRQSPKYKVYSLKYCSFLLVIQSNNSGGSAGLVCIRPRAQVQVRR